MKTKLSLSKSTKGLLCLVVAGSLLLLSSCLKNDNNNLSVQASGMALINAAPGSPALDFYSEDTRNNLPTQFAYDTVLSYWGAYPGFRVFGVTLHNSNQFLGSKQFYLKPGNAYSLFVTDTIGAIKLVCLDDSLDVKDSTTGNIRFANMSADAPALNLILKSTKTTTIKDIAYSKASDFGTIDPATNYTLQLVEASSGQVLVSKSNIKIEKGHIYTVWAKGIYKGKVAATKLDIGIMENS